MSLKAKIEAVIYACEEPVTLAQLAGALGGEAHAELAQLQARQGRLHLAESGEAAVEADPETAPEPVTEPTGDLPQTPAAEPVEIAAEPGDAAAKRQARERERQVRDFIREQIDQLIVEYAVSGRGIEIREVAGGFRMGTKPEFHDAVRGFVKSLKPPLKLSLQALETLAVVAYKQPVTAPEVSEIRGVDSGGVLGSLLARKLVTTAGRKQVIGRPILYKTTKDFLLRFGLKDVAELPSIEEFEKMAGELAAQEEIPMSDAPSERESAEQRIAHENLRAEEHSKAPQADGDDEDLTPDGSNRAGGDMPTLDGRESGLPPTYDDARTDPSAADAEIQNEAEGS